MADARPPVEPEDVEELAGLDATGTPGGEADPTPCGYLSTTPDGLVVRVNATLLAMTGWQRDAVEGRMLFVDLLTAGGRIYHETHFAPILRMVGSAREIAFDLLRPDGGSVPVLVNAVLDRDADGEPLAVRTAVFEATNRRTYERELLDARRRAESSERRAVSLARTLQQTLIPPAPPVVPGLDIAAAYRSAGAGDEVGGDFYDVFELRPGRWAVAIGDVCGKGVDAAVVTSLARHTLRAAAVDMEHPSDALHVLNDVLVQAGSERFLTVGLLLLQQDEEGWTLTVSSGGHPLPILVHRGGEVSAVGDPGSLLGVLGDPSLSDTEVRLAHGDTVVLYTDGISEGRRAGEFYGDDRLQSAISRYGDSAHHVVDGLLGEVLAFQDGDPRDDIALVAVGLPVSA